ncbi:triphosphoribosyl-dephospho-CoA synthase CitG [Furfurilactobacillus siliginis]|uniref:Probable 2-(5''-triphosphoribosyl)-3'-dephosphocoenzyme-A synthase n=1 Tax=Furfurilactobacillus siliginis TaxID=348151 RepID=A0A0R2L4Y9_9LACO|nr:triphosphoribosyl-dephospho-CoA synthase CitG [Furfurilactobacillus siliginis]KRN94886.1 triphosphoribosyl-dephospho-CoA synthase [Furfurilactobacillus siliginis]GEK28458.1 putative 2-(5''-triphosphoribosyl)-3'-dephosphocoenzyme-A synthase [Furfurilactobacillus siliginis]
MVDNNLPLRLTKLAQRALLYEVSVNPKPGLVDPVSAGAHPDMDVFMFIDSATSLLDYFEKCAQAGITAAQTGTIGRQLFQVIRPLGVVAEQEMFAATGGVNTHKGAVFSLGVIVTATAVQMTVDSKYSTERVIAITKQMLKGLVSEDFERIQQKDPVSLTAGERQFLQYGKTGIRGEAEAGFPTVTELALPALRKSTGSTMQRLLDTLIHIAGNTDDSNLIKRAGTPTITAWMHDQADYYFSLGGSKIAAGREFLNDLDVTFTKRHLSLGGSADLLILTIYFGLLEGII